MGRVTLVGAGPGDSGLLTEKGRQALEQAEVVLYDRLVSLGVLGKIPYGVQCIDVGKKPNQHPVPQEEINQMIIDYAKQGKNVVRLKGGDPYLFGRGGEELEEIVKAGIPFQVIPGVSSALAVPAYGGIPVTYRGRSSSVHIITAHGQKNTTPDIPYKQLATMGGTLVFLMGVGRLDEITKGLIAAKMKPNTPCALIHKGSTSQQRTVTSTLSQMWEKSQEEGLKPPCVFVVGEVTTLSPDLNWFEKQPLFGISTLVVQPPATASKLSALLEAEGASVAALAGIGRVPRELSQEDGKKILTADWIVFTSPFGVETFFHQLGGRRIDLRQMHEVRFAVVGSATNKTLENHGFIADFMPEKFDGDALAEGLALHLKPTDRVVLYRSAQGREEIREKLQQLVSTLDDIPAYDTHLPHGSAPFLKERLEAGEIDVVLLTSASTAEGFARLAGDTDLHKITTVCIGEQTAAKARTYGMTVHVSREATLVSMTEKLKELKGRNR